VHGLVQQIREQRIAPEHGRKEDPGFQVAVHRNTERTGDQCYDFVCIFDGKIMYNSKYT
jgi:hypothetical protein